jgi:hypothetical protein
MNNILLKRLNANNTTLEECESFFSKYIKAWKISQDINLNKYVADNIRISAGPHKK